jgi:acetyl-CoA carboxylase biotin carboxylase subunit
MFSKLMITNRGEIACRVIRTCKKMGIRTIAVYSDADSGALHVQMADEAAPIGPAIAAESYLNTDRILKAAKLYGADAIHPGYGFLSENTSFVRAVESSGISFIGPSAKAISQMGDKIAARKIAKAAGVPVIPGTNKAIANNEAVEEARQIGYPLMIKAADGGGGIGIRVVTSEIELITALERARSQAQASFGSNRMYIEKQIQPASHVEVQILADSHGNIVHLFERDCSAQRRNQKILEETPCAKISQETRGALTQSAVQLAKSIGYVNAGTVEYLVDQDGNFYFMEMNTRLQVEHPITEMVTGVDLVEMQIRIAAGETLPFKQSDVTLTGTAIETRIYPENPVSLAPSIGIVESIVEPDGDHVRIDSALFPGYEVLPHYEPMMAKLITWGKDRPSALSNMKQALTEYKIRGVETNIPLLHHLIGNSSFADATYHTGFVTDLLNKPTTASAGKEFIASMAVAFAIQLETAEKLKPSKWRMYARKMSMFSRLSNGVS